LKDSISPKAVLLASAIVESGDSDGLLLLVDLENRLRQPLINWRTIQGAVTEHVPSEHEHWRGAFDVFPVAATELRQKLLAMTTDGGLNDAAARVLREIDRIRDENPAPNDEPRHPDLASGKPWPILLAVPDGEGSVHVEALSFKASVPRPAISHFILGTTVPRSSLGQLLHLVEERGKLPVIAR